MPSFTTRSPLSLFFLLVLPMGAWVPAQDVFTAPQVVAGPGAGFEFVTVITLQNNTPAECMAEVRLHRGPGQAVGVALEINGQPLQINPFDIRIPALTAQRLRITAAPGAGLFQGAARVTDRCNGLEISAGFDVVPGAGAAAVPAAGAGTPPEIFNYVSGLPVTLLPGVVGRAVVDIDPRGVDGLQNTPGIAVVGDPTLPAPDPGAVDLCHRVVDSNLQPQTPIFCAPFDGEHFTMNLDQIFPGIPALDDATWEFFVQGPINPPVRADVLVIDVTSPNQFRGVPIGTFNQQCGPNDLCLNNDRFRVSVQANDGTSTSTGQLQRLDADSGLFFFPGLNQNNFELLINIINGCAFNDHYWVFYAATTNVEYRISVTDTETNQTRDYDNILGTPAPAVTDTMAFATCP